MNNPTRGLAIRALVVGIALVSASPPSVARDEPSVVPADQAAKHVGEECVVEMTVLRGKDGIHGKRYYLDSKEDYKDSSCFTVIIAYEHLDAFRKAGIDDPAHHYRGKTLRVTGKVVREEDQTRMRIDSPQKIKIVGGPKSDSAK